MRKGAEGRDEGKVGRKKKREKGEERLGRGEMREARRKGVGGKNE